MERDGLGERGLVRANRLAQRHAPVLARFFGKFLVDILPAALASAVGGFLFTQYQYVRPPAAKPLEQVTPASTEMMKLVRDEHAAIMDYLKAQSAAEKSRMTAEDEEAARAAVADKPADADAPTAAKVAVAEPARSAAAAPSVPAPRRLSAAALARSAARNRAPAVAAVTVPTHPPLVIAQVDPNAAAVPPGPAPREPQSLLAKTLDVRDHIVDGAAHVVSALGSIPAWIVSMGDRLSGNGQAQPDAHIAQFGSW